MPGSILSQWVIPIVVACALFSWVGAVLYADAHPRYKHHAKLPRYEVTGGAFEANDGGRQLMPIAGERPFADRPAYEASASSAQVPAQRTAPSPASASAPGPAPGGASTSVPGPASSQAAAGRPGVPRQRAAAPGQRVGRGSRLVEGSKLRLVLCHGLRYKKCYDTALEPSKP
jgi:hypothetical protein